MKSIMHKKDGTCYLCMKLHQDYSEKSDLEEHHVIYGSRHKLAERYGLKVYLCAAHHRLGPEAVHFNEDVCSELKDEAQRAFELHFPELDFMEIFQKNYKFDKSEEPKNETNGFIPLKGVEI